jgi:hypothetical protein
MFPSFLRARANVYSRRDRPTEIPEQIKRELRLFFVRLRARWMEQKLSKLV